jgi:hypothetical protein
MRLAAALALLIATGVLSSPGLAPADPALAQEALGRLHVSPDQQRNLLQHDVVSYPVDEHSERELAVGVAVLVRAPLAHVAEFLGSDDLLAADASIAARGPMPDPARPALPAVGFDGDERGEAESLLDAGPGTRFNLSPAEIAGLRAFRASAGQSEIPTARISDQYRKLLRDRGDAYRRGGLRGIAPYARSGGAVTDPSAELRSAGPDAVAVVRYGAELQGALERYPAGRPEGLVDRVYWIKRRVQRRPQLSLLHQVVLTRADVVAHVERYFYVGHSYNAAQIVTGAFAHDDGTVVFSTSRFSTDEVLGLGNQLKRSIGRAQLRDEMRRRLEAIAYALSRPGPSAPQAP